MIDFNLPEGSICEDRQTKENRVSNPNTVNIFLLMEKAKELNIRQCGSSAIEPRFKQTCDFVTTLMAERFSVFIYPHSNFKLPEWDHSGRLYIGGSKRSNDSKAVNLVTVAEYLELFTSDGDYAGIDEKTLCEFDEICRDFLSMIDSPRTIADTRGL